MTDLAPGALVYAAPGGYTWTRDRDHHAEPMSVATQALLARAYSAGFASTFRRYGLPLADAKVVYVHGWAYMRMVPVGAPDRPGSGKPPPPWLMKILTRVHPEMRRRAKTAATALAERRWVADADTWQAERPGREQALAARQAIDLSTLDDGALAAHVEEAAAGGEEMLRRHFELVGPALGMGRLLVFCTEQGIAPTDALTVLRGFSPASAATEPIIAGLAGEMDAAGAGDVSDLGALRAVSARAAELVDTYMSRFGWRVLDDDITGTTAAEQPRLLYEAVRARRCGERADAPDADAAVRSLRARVSEADRATFDELVEDARRCYRSMDDNSGFVSWALGLMRRAYLAAGERLAARGALADASHVFSLESAEVAALLRGATQPSGDDVSTCEAERAAAIASDAPVALGPPSVGGPPDPSVFPSAMGQLTKWIGMYIGMKFSDDGGRPSGRTATGVVTRDGSDVATGHGIGHGSVTGRAVRVSDPAEAIAELEPGDILVCPFTTPAYNVVFSLVAGVVTEHGGPLGHTAVMAREFGFPAVIGAGPLDVRTGDVLTITAAEATPARVGG